MLNSKQFVEAMEIITRHHSNKVEINRLTNSTVDTGAQNIRLELTDCVPSVINELKKADFMLNMRDGRLLIDKI